jgi:hypothetical protein
MRLRACLGMLLLATAGCAQFPNEIRLQVDGNSIDIKKKPLAPLPTNEAQPADEAAPR